MKKILLSVCCFFAFNALAMEQNCINEVNNFEKKFKACVVDYSNDSSTAGMNNAVYNKTDCQVLVLNEIFDKYYSTTAQESKEQFDSFLKQIYSYAHHLKQQSDYAKKYHTGTMYNSMAISHADEMVKQIVESYLKEIRFECEMSM